ncbi:histidinol-phosphate transaminase [Biomaibacter acetigenes]|uniref:Histidinol-phosphate aminotransferase n=1 Tax=Biomaibacter acetigenes TaxID=2316383 RepID=A0A3G2R5Q7_9FIRM|nr:histidinol-phosphate transaminase [Biomaibacter acetigenes]
MNPGLKFVRQDILGLEPYKPSKEACSIKLDANESPYDIPQEVKERIWQRLKREKINFYYDPSCDELREELSKYVGVKPVQIFVGSGSDEIISDLLFAFAGPGRDVIIPVPAFSSYEIFATVSGANVIKVPLLLEKQNEAWRWDLDVEGIKKHFKKDEPQMMFLCYPNNPTGDYFSEEKILDLIESFNGIVAVDEAYFEFGRKTFANRLSKYPNVTVIRTFSKIFSMAGLRVGYAIADETIIEQLYKVKLPYNVTLFSQIAAVEILKNLDWVEALRDELVKSRDELKAELDRVPGIIVYPSNTNFFLCEFEKPRDLVYEKLLEKGILTRKLNGEKLKNVLRFCVGSPEQNNVLVDALRQILSE